jgi:hypothetical protein
MRLGWMLKFPLSVIVEVWEEEPRSLPILGERRCPWGGGRVIRLQRIYNFLCSMLVLHHLTTVSLHFVALLCIFWN